MDPRTSLGYHREYRISNYTLMRDMIHYCRNMAADHILQLPDIQERVHRYTAQELEFQAMIRANSHAEGNVLVIDLLEVDDIKSGNRFKEYAMFPAQNISLRILWGPRRENVVITCGHSILNRTSRTNVGDLMLRYGGGGHTRVGTCQVPVPDWMRVRNELIEAIREVPAENETLPCSRVR
jgi:nanoRNase/pAp phosphatase (c-di-AMP/oligoRNAs hydrolase)